MTLIPKGWYGIDMAFNTDKSSISHIGNAEQDGVRGSLTIYFDEQGKKISEIFRPFEKGDRYTNDAKDD